MRSNPSSSQPKDPQGKDFGKGLNPLAEEDKIQVKYLPEKLAPRETRL